MALAGSSDEPNGRLWRFTYRACRDRLLQGYADKELPPL